MRGSHTIALFFLLSSFLQVACGPGSKGPRAVISSSAESSASRDGGALILEDAGPQEPNVPFSMLGGGPRHQHRAQIPGPRTEPVQKASFRTGARVFASPVIGPDGSIYVGSLDGTFSALKRDGNLRFSYICDEPIFSTAAISRRGLVYVGCDDDHLYAFSTEGVLRFMYRMTQDVDSAPTIAESGTIYVGGDGLHALRPNGKRIFKLWLGGHVSASPCVRPDGVVVVGSHDHLLYAVNEKGTVLWGFATKGALLGPVAALEHNDVVFGSEDKNVYRLAASGGMRWKYGTGGPVFSGIAVAEDESVFYVTSMDGFLYALRGQNGKPLWKVNLGGPLGATPMLDNEGVLYVGSHDKYLYAIDAGTGHINWKYYIGSEIDSTVAVTVGRQLVVASDDGAIRILGEIP